MDEIEGIKVVADTNIIVSALLFGGTPGKLVSLWKEKRIIPVVCKEMTDESLRVLAYPKFRLSDKEIEYLFYKEVMPYVRNTHPTMINAGHLLIVEHPEIINTFIRRNI